MQDLKENLNDTKYLLEETDYKNINTNNIQEEINLKNNLLNNTLLLLEDKSSILNDISLDNIKQIQEKTEYNKNNNINQKEQKYEQENSIKDILIKNINKNNNEEKEKIKEEQEIIKQQNILLNNQNSHLDNLLYLSYNDIVHNKNININKQIIYFGVVFPTEKIIKNFTYKNDDKKKILIMMKNILKY